MSRRRPLPPLPETMPDAAAFAGDLLDWYDAHARDLPWRGDGVSPYRTWVSEIMLQQTRVDTATPYFERFMARFPMVEDLAAADLDEVLSMWAGLGYYSRARNLHKAAGMVAEAGVFPTDVAGLRALPGIGEYVAGAVGSIALGLPVPAVDGNLERVLARVTATKGGRRQMAQVAQVLIDGGQPERAGDWNQALMDVGSSVCTPRAPRCGNCPLADHCHASRRPDPTVFPEKVVRRKAPIRHAVAGVVVGADSRVLVARRPSEGLFGGLYELPGQLFDRDGEPGAKGRPGALADAWRARLGVPVAVGVALGTVKHTLTHMRLRLHVYEVSLDGDPTPHDFYTELEWIDAAAPEKGISTLTTKALKLVKTSQQTLFSG